MAAAFDSENLAALAAYLRSHVADFPGTIAVEKFKGGQSNPTYLVKAGDKSYVLRRKPQGVLLPSAHAVDREYRVITALEKTAVPVAKTYALCLDDAVIGTAFYIMDYVPGRIFWDPSLPGMNPLQRAAIFAEMNRVISALHSVDVQAVALADYGRPGNYIARQVARWSKQYQASETEKIVAMDKLIDWLPEHIPGGEETSLVHGDFRIDNLIFHPSEAKILAVLDWELSTLGHPLADFAYHCLAWRLAPGQFRGLLGHDLAALGIPCEADYVAAYCQRTGREGVVKQHWEFYLIYNLFRLAAILQGVMARAVQGNAASSDALAAGRRARPLAEEAWRQVERIERIIG